MILQNAKETLQLACGITTESARTLLPYLTIHGETIEDICVLLVTHLEAAGADRVCVHYCKSNLHNWTKHKHP